ncbi:MAG TPA: VanZ family protein [Rhizomicrobium sp.]|nr:VanZ family protein [Rhizomicrobium sp.]
MTPLNSGTRRRSAPLFFLAAVVAVLVAYGSLYPFDFRGAGSLGADIAQFLAGWRRLPSSPGDILANFLLYMPLGLAVTLAFAQAMPRPLAAFLTLMCGACLSLFIELAQFYDLTRVSAFSDFFLNVVGLIVGIVAALIGGAGLVKSSWPPGSAPDFARLLLLAWLAWQLFPYVPTLEIHNYWRSLKPVLLAHPIDLYNLFRYTALWLSVAFLFRIAVGRSIGLFVLAVLVFFAAKASIIEQFLSLEELSGAAIALLVLPLLARRFSSLGVPLIATLLLLVVILTRLLPWQLAATPKPFQWIPFYSFLHASKSINIVSFAEKFYLYGAALLLSVQAGIGLRLAVALECIILFACSFLQTFMAGRSAEISDAILALILGVVYTFLRQRHRDGGGIPSPTVPAELGN